MIDSSDIYFHDPAAFENKSFLQELFDPILSRRSIRLFIKRDDLIHPHISGNKWRKLKYNLTEARKNNYSTLLTFGGAYSNHIYAVAAAGKEFGFKTIGLIRGEKVLPLNNTLSFAEACGMQLHFISREDYRLKEETNFLDKLSKQLGNFYLLPEGGTNMLAVKGCTEIIDEIAVDFDYICCPCGTGGTMTGLCCSIAEEKKVIGFSVLKGMNDLEGKVEKLILDFCGRKLKCWSVNHDYHFGGYAKTNETLFSFMAEFESAHAIALDQVYTGKMMYGVFDLIKRNYFKPSSTIIAIHTGGLQGRNIKITV